MLERVIFPAIYADPDVGVVLFVGVSSYTSWYPSLFRTRPRLRFTTIDPDPDAARWGARGEHRVVRLEDLAAETGSRELYDLVIANGLFGFGTDSKQACAAVIDASHPVLE